MKVRNSIECYIVRENSNLDIEILLLHKPKTNRHPAFWQPITGGIEKDEESIDACVREIMEETNINVSFKAIEDLNYKFEIFIEENDLVIKKALFMCKNLTPNFEVKISDEHDDFMWVKLEEVKNYLYWDSNKNTFIKVYEKLVI
jgi:dATP pyrophosphohydrolase